MKSFEDGEDPFVVQPDSLVQSISSDCSSLAIRSGNCKPLLLQHEARG